VLLGAWVGTSAMADVLPNKGQGLEEIGLLVLFGILFAWISAGFWTGVMGAIELLRGPGRGPLARRVADAPILPLDPGGRTRDRHADLQRACADGVRRPGGDDRFAAGSPANRRAFDVFVLSDSNDADIRAAEQAAWSDLAHRHRRASAGATRRRCASTTAGASAAVKRKAGNVADFCRRWGAAYRYFIVLDADSVMTGECLTTLVRMMEAHPDAGIIQTAPTRGRPRDAARPGCSSSVRAPTGRSSPPACASGSSASRTTGATTRSCAWRPS
jgi:membrane glycosyltransferase